jgi:hypothetical protein
LVADDAEQDKTMQEATVFMMPQRLRYLFALLLVHQTPKNPEKLWDKYISSMSEDYVKKGIILLSRHPVNSE